MARGASQPVVPPAGVTPLTGRASSSAPSTANTAAATNRLGFMNLTSWVAFPYPEAKPATDH